MSDPNQATKKRQLMLVGGTLTAVAVLGIVGSLVLDDGSPTSTKRQTKPTTINIAAPGTVDDKDVWRANEGAKGVQNETMLKELRDQMNAQKAELERLKVEQGRAKNGTPNGTPVAVAATNTADVADALAKPLPGAPGQPQQAVGQKIGQMANEPLPAAQATPTRILPPPGGSRAPLPNTLNQPLNQAPYVPSRQLEIIEFGNGNGGGGRAGSGGGGGKTEVQGFPVDESAKKYQTSQGQDSSGRGRVTIDFIPAGSFIKVAMLNGVDAPTGGQAQGNPLPVAFHVLDVANLANKHKLDIKDCRIVAAAWGDLSSERMMGRTETLTCIINDEAVEMAIKGTVIGEDGKAGVRGKLITKQGSILANALFAGALSGIGKAFQQSATTTTTSGLGTTQTVDPGNVTNAALGGGVSSAASILAQYYLKAADKLFPIIETDGGRVVEILIQKGATYTGPNLRKDSYKELLSRNSPNRTNEDD